LIVSPGYKFMKGLQFYVIGLAVWAVAAASLLPAEPDGKIVRPPETVSYARDIRRILQMHCQGCHQPAKAMGGLVLTTHASLLQKGDSGLAAVVPGKPDRSHLIEQVTAHNARPPAMPKGKEALVGRDVNLLVKWITQGAADDTPQSDRQTVDEEHPPTYALPPVVTSLAYSPDGTLLAVAGRHEVLLHKSDGSGPVGRLIGLSERIQSLAFSPDGKQLAVAGGDPCMFGELQVWDIAHKKLKLSTMVTADTLYGVSWSPDGSKIAFGCADNTVRAVDAQSGKQVLFQGAHNDWVLETVFSTDGSHLVTVSRDMSMKLIEVATQRFVDNITSITPGALKGGLQSVARHPKKDELLIGGSDGTPKIYRMHRQMKRVIGDDFNLIRTFEPMPGRIFSVRYNADGSRILVGSSFEQKGEARVYQTGDGRLVAKLQGQKGGVFAVAYRPDGKAVASAGFDGMVRVNEPDTGKLIREFVPVPVLASTLARGASQ
jgi:WD40 repeat protein